MAYTDTTYAADTILRPLKSGRVRSSIAVSGNLEADGAGDRVAGAPLQNTGGARLGGVPENEGYGFP